MSTEIRTNSAETNPSLFEKLRTAPSVQTIALITALVSTGCQRHKKHREEENPKPAAAATAAPSGNPQAAAKPATPKDGVVAPPVSDTPSSDMEFISDDPLTCIEDQKMARLSDQLFTLINAARYEAGVPALAYDCELARVAQGHSNDMAAKDYVAHVNPNDPLQRGPTDRMAAAHIKFDPTVSYADGENVARSYSVPEAHVGLMGSPLHSENILKPGFTHIGIGMAQANGTVLPTELFASGLEGRATKPTVLFGEITDSMSGCGEAQADAFRKHAQRLTSLGRVSPLTHGEAQIGCHDGRETLRIPYIGSRRQIRAGAGTE